MGATKKSKALAPATNSFDEVRLAEGEKATQEMATIQHLYSQGRDLVNQLLGQAQMANAFSQFSRTVSASKLAIVKENKLYQQLAGAATPNGSVLKGTWEDFCGLLGISVDKADIDIANVKAFGEEALENMSRIGIGYRDLRQYRRLGQDERTALIEAAKSGDKDELLDLAETLISKQEAITKRAEEAEADLEASRKRVGVKEAELEKKTKELARAKKHIESLTPDEEGAELRAEVSQLAFNTEASILGALTIGFEALENHASSNDCTHEEFMSGCLFSIERALIGLRNRFNVKERPDGDEMPAWLRPGAEEEAHKKIAEGEAKRAQRNNRDK